MNQQNEHLTRIQTALGKRIKTLRQQKGLSQQAFSVACGIDRTHLGRIERGQVDACIEVLAEIGKRLYITVADLFQDIA